MIDIDRSEALNIFQALDAMMNNQKPRTAARKVINLIFDKIEEQEAEFINVDANTIEVEIESL